MHDIERRAFMKGAAIGALAFTVGGAEVLLTPRAARAQGVPLRTLTAAQAATLDALGETLVPGARQAGISHFVDQQISIPAEEALLEARILNVRPPNSYGQTHEIPNLYVAGPGIFATAGASNPTYTILALSLRGAERLVADWSTVAG